MNPDLEGKKILVTGASSGIGLQSALRIAEFGGTVVAVGRSPEKLKALSEQLGSGHRTESFDLREFSNYAALAESIGELDGLVHSAGEGFHQPIRTLKKIQWDDHLNINLACPIFLTQEFLKRNLMKIESSVIFISSTAASRPNASQLSYSISKAGLLNAAKVFSAEFSKSKRVRFNCVSPGLVDTPMFEKFARMLDPKSLENIVQSYPLGIGKAKDVADAIVFLLSSRSGWMTGTELKMDGGWSCL